MATANNLTRTFPVTVAMSKGTVVQLHTDGYIRPNPINQFGIGVLLEDVTANAYENPAVRLWVAGTVPVSVTGTPLTAGNLVYAVTGGQVAGTNGFVGTTNGGRIVGSIVETTGNTQNGNLFEVQMFTSIGA
jgi:uncharacterized protein YdaL